MARISWRRGVAGVAGLVSGAMSTAAKGVRLGQLTVTRQAEPSPRGHCARQSHRQDLTYDTALGECVMSNSHVTNVFSR